MAKYQPDPKDWHHEMEQLRHHTALMGEMNIKQRAQRISQYIMKKKAERLAEEQSRRMDQDRQ